MGIKGAITSSCLLAVLTAAPALSRAQDNPDEVATQRSAEDRADAMDVADPSDMDRSLVDPDYAPEPTDDDPQIHESDAARQDRPGNTVRNPKSTKSRLGAGAVQTDSEDLVDDAENDPKDGSRTPDRRAKKDANKDPAKYKDSGKKDVAKKDAPKADADKKAGAAKDTSKRPAGCVDVSTEARFASIGYDHIVTLKSECKKTVKCQVRTNVTAEPSSVTLAPAAQESLVTWRGSPARVFTPDVTCK
jgi:hypothetical protein